MPCLSTRETLKSSFPSVTVVVKGTIATSGFLVGESVRKEDKCREGKECGGRVLLQDEKLDFV